MHHLSLWPIKHGLGHAKMTFGDVEEHKSTDMGIFADDQIKFSAER